MSVTTAQVITLLENVLFESPTLAATNAPTWVTLSASNSDYASIFGLANAMADGPENSIVQQVVRYYEGALGRAPAGFEIQYYVDIVEQGLAPAQIAQGASAVPQSSWDIIASDFANSPEFTFISSGSNVVSLLYFNILRRVPGPTEIAYYNDQLLHGLTVGTLVQEFTNSPEYQTSVNSTIQAALAGYGVAVVSGNTPTTIPLTGANQQIIQALGSDNAIITGKDTTQLVTVNGTPATAGQLAVTAATGVIAVAGVTAATGVQGVTAVAFVAPAVGQNEIDAASDGAVTITDAAFDGGGAGTITTITLNSSGSHSVINDNALVNLTLTGTAGSLTINNNGSNNVLNLTVNGLTNIDNALTDTQNEIQTLDITTTGADSTLAAFTDSNLTTLNLSGSNMLTWSAINRSLTNLNVTGSAGFSDGATTHTGGLAALGSALTISLSSSGTFSAALDDTKQGFTGGPGTDIIMVSATADATKLLTAGTAGNNEIVFEGGGFGLTSSSTGKFVNFQIVGVANNVSGTIDLSLIDATATGLEVRGANSIAFTKVAAAASLLLDPSTGASVSVTYADSNGASDSIAVTMSSNVANLTLQDAAGVGLGGVTVENDLGANDTNISSAHTIGTFNDKGLSTLTVSGDAGLSISSLTLTGTSFTLDDQSSNGRGVALGTLTDDALTTLAFSGPGASSVALLNSNTASLSIANSGSTVAAIGFLNSTLTKLTLSDNVALGQAATALVTNGLQDNSAAGVTVDGGADNAHVTVNLLVGAPAGATDSITLGNGNNIVVDNSTDGTVNVSLGSGANLVELGNTSLDTTGLYTVTLAARTATPPNVIMVGSAGSSYATAANLTITGISAGDVIAFGNDSSSSGASLTATSLSAATSASDAISTLEAASAAHKVVYGVYGGNTYLVESLSGVAGAGDTTVIEIIGAQTLTATTGYVTIGSTATTLPAGTLQGGNFTIPAGTVTNLPLTTGANVVTLTGPSNGVSDTLTGVVDTTGLTINYRATSGTDTVNLTGINAVASLTINDLSVGSAGITIGAFSDNALTTATYNNSAAAGAVMTQQALTSSTLATINFSGGVAGRSTNNYFFTGNLGTSGGVTINDTNIGSGTTTMGLTMAGNALTLDMTGPGTLATGVLTDNVLASLAITGSGTGKVDVGTLVDAYADSFTVKDDSSSTGGTTIRLSGLSAATSLTINDTSAGDLADATTFTDAALTTLTLNNDGSGKLTLGGAVGMAAGSITANALTSITIGGSGTGGIVLGALTDTVAADVTITDTNTSGGSVSLPLSGLSAATSLTVRDYASGNLDLGAVADNAMTKMTLFNYGSAQLSVGTISADALAELDVGYGTGGGTITLGNISDMIAGRFGIVDASLSAGDVTVGIAALPNATSFDAGVNAGNLTVNAFTDNSAATFAFLNNGAGALTISGITTSTTSDIEVDLTGEGTGTQDVTLIDSGSGILVVDDDSTSTGAITFRPTLSAASGFGVTDSASGDLTVTAISDTALVAAVLSNTGQGLLTVTGMTNTTTTGMSVFGELDVEGTGAITTALMVGATAGTVTIDDTDSGTVTLTSLNIGGGAGNTGTLAVTNGSGGNLVVSGGTIYATTLTLAATGLGSNDVTLSDLAAGATTVTLSGAGRQSLTLTHTGISGDQITLGDGPVTLTLHDATAADTVNVTFGAGSATVTMDAGRTASSTFTFGAAAASNANTPVTADIINNFVTDHDDAGPPLVHIQGDVIKSSFTNANILTMNDVNPSNTNFWTINNISAPGMLSKPGASVLNFIAEVQSLTQAGAVANTNGIAGFLDGQGNTWIAYNDHAGHVSVIELVGVTATGLTAGTAVAGFIHIG